MGDAPLTPFPRESLVAPAEDVAQRLLGAYVVSDLPPGRVVVRLTEVEAYAGEQDPGSHAYRGRTPRTEVMFGEAGHVYVYFSYGMHWCANLVCGSDGTASAVLMRAGEVVEGIEVARERRGGVVDRDLARGPARLAQALGLSREHNGLDVTAPAGPFAVLASPQPAPAVVRSGPRVGVSGAGGDGAQYPWRFWLDGDPTVSAYRGAKPRRPRAPR